MILRHIRKLVPMQPGDVPVTYADTSALERDFGFKPSTSLREGLQTGLHSGIRNFINKKGRKRKMKIAVAGTGYVGLIHCHTSGTA